MSEVLLGLRLIELAVRDTTLGTHIASLLLRPAILCDGNLGQVLALELSKPLARGGSGFRSPTNDDLKQACQPHLKTRDLVGRGSPHFAVVSCGI